MRQPVRSAFTLVLLAIFLQVPAHATLLVPATLEELAASAAAIFHGRVIDARSQWSEGRRRIDTWVTFEVRGYLKGSFGPTVVVKVPGGRLGAYRSVVIGAPAFSPGDEAVVFVGSAAPLYPFILGLNQGVFRVVRGPGGEASVVSPVVERSGLTPGRIVRGDPRRVPISLDQFLRRVRELVR